MSKHIYKFKFYHLIISNHYTFKTTKLVHKKKTTTIKYISIYKYI